MTMNFEPDYRHFAEVMHNRRPARLPVYEHLINPSVMERILGVSFLELEKGTVRDQAEFFRHYCRFFREMTYDTVSYEVCISQALPGPSAICGGRGLIQTRSDFNAYPWRDAPARFWAIAEPRFEAFARALPPGMKGVGGIGNGVFEIAESLVGLEYLPLMEMDDPALYADLYRAIGDLMSALWAEFMPRYGRHFVACRFGDDLGFKSSLLTHPSTVRQHLLPQYRRVIDIVHGAGGVFLWHSCGCIFEIMDDVIALGIQAKHSNEDTIAPFSRWIDLYGGRIGLLGGFDLGRLCALTEREVFEVVFEEGQVFRAKARGYALGSGNSIPDYLPPENYQAMIRAAQEIRKQGERG